MTPTSQARIDAMAERAKATIDSAENWHLPKCHRRVRKQESNAKWESSRRV